MQASLEDGHHVGVAVEAEDDDGYGEQRLHATRLPSLISWQAAGPSNSDATMHGRLQIAVA